ncbi:MAG: WG repeat-containing protein [Chitinophagaceae bacterium]|nr:WG repeat-containing protein [Chitinophagaceae bacterium]
MADAKGVLFLQPEYDYISDVKFNKLYTKTKGKYTVLDRSLKQLIAADSAENVYLGKTKIVYLDKKKIRVFDAEGKFLKTIEQANAKVYGSAFSAKEDSFYIGHDKMVCLINLSTNKISMLPFTEASDFSEEGYFMARSVYYSFLNHRGEIVSPISYPSAVPFAEGVCALQAGNFDLPYLAGKDFKKISTLYTSFKGPFSEGLAFTVDASTNKLVYIDKKGNRVFEVEGKEGGACKEGRIPILTPYGEYFFVDEKGKMIGTKKWKMISEFKEGLAAVRDNGKWGFIDRSGTLVIPLQYDEVSSFTGGAAIVKKDGAYLIIDKTGTPTSDKRFEAAASPDNGFFPVKKEGKVGVVDKKGNTVIGFQYDNIRPISEDRAWAAKDGKWALLDNKGKALTEFKYADGSDMKNGYAIIKQNGKAGLINKSGKVAVPAEYTQIGSVYQNTVVAIRAEGTLGYSLK